ncbi:MAG: EpsG family protein [Lachnospiraceae bacterium]|jgi:hypothetical protein|nr:EpsG family protein [Lachnospiraceae bacterium]
MYILTGFIIVIFAGLGYLDRKADKYFFYVEILILTVMLCLRYGQGTDYFGYEFNYSLIPNDMNIDFLFNNNVHGEVGYTLLVGIFRRYGLSFQIFVGILSLVMMWLTYNSIKNYSENKTMAIALLFPTYYLTFYYAIRQGFGLALTLGVILPSYIKDQKMKYFIWVCLGATMHKSVLILLIPLFCKEFIVRHKEFFIASSIILGGIIGILLKMTAFNRGYVQFSPSINAILLRVILFIAITRLYKFSLKEDKINYKIYNLYIVGFCIYMTLCSMAFISHRLTAYMKIGEVILVARLLSERSCTIEHIKSGFLLLKHHVCLLALFVCIIEGTKNIESYVGQGEYYEGIHFYNYPYVSVFNKKDIYEYRENLFFDKAKDIFEVEKR